MTDKDYLMDILDTEKWLTTNMAYALNEASCKSLYKEYFQMFENISKSAKEVFNLAYNLGYYKLEQEKPQKIESKLQTLSQELESLDSTK